MAIDTIHKAVRDVLVNDAGVTAITSTVKPWMLWRTDELPAVTYENVSQGNFFAYDGQFTWEQRRIQLDCWSNNYDQAHSLARAVLNAIKDHTDTTHGSVYVHRLRVEDVADLPQDPEQGKEQPPYAVRIDVVAAYELTS